MEANYEFDTLPWRNDSASVFARTHELIVTSFVQQLNKFNGELFSINSKLPIVCFFYSRMKIFYIYCNK